MRLLIILAISIVSEQTLTAQVDKNVKDTTIVFGEKVINYTDGTWIYLKDLPPPKIEIKDSVKRDIEEIQYEKIFESQWITQKANFKPELSLLSDDSLFLDIRHQTDEIFLPIGGYVSSKYGLRWNKKHQGVDLSLKDGKEVFSAFDGVVRYSGKNGGYGNLIIVRHYNGLETYYAHLSKRLMKVGDKVKAGDLIAIGGNTGHSTGPHLHFEIRFLNRSINPEIVFNFSERKILINELFFYKNDWNE